jgi:hypothetical protein
MTDRLEAAMHPTLGLVERSRCVNFDLHMYTVRKQARSTMGHPVNAINALNGYQRRWTRVSSWSDVSSGSRK